MYYCPEHGWVESTTGGCPHSIHHYPIELEPIEKSHLQGWECPKCGSVYGPFVQECDQCKNSNVRTIDSTNTKETTI